MLEYTCIHVMLALECSSPDLWLESVARSLTLFTEDFLELESLSSFSLS